MAERAARPAALCIAIVGAESTGKTTLAQALAPRLAQDTGLRVAWVPELLREWCEHTGRTPLAHEQASVLRGQTERIDAAAATHDVVVCDTTALMTAVYSRYIFQDRTLEIRAAQLHRRMALTLLMALDLPWVSDGLQRDGPQVREPVDALIRELLQAHGLPWCRVHGHGEARLESAVAAVAPWLPARGDASRKGLFSGLQGSAVESSTAAWRCASCDDPSCAHRPRRLDPTRV